MSMPLPSYSSARGRLGVLFAVPLVFSLLFFVVNTVSERNDEQLTRTQQLSSGIGKMRSVANDAEVGEHGFLLTGNERYLDTLRSADLHLQGFIQAVHRYDPERQLGARWAETEGLIRRRVLDANEVVRIEQKKGVAAAIQQVRLGHSELVMERIRGEIESLQQQLGQQTKALMTRDTQLARLLFLLFVVGSFVMFLVLHWLYRSAIKDMQARDAAHAELRLLNTQLETRIDERTLELRRSNEELQQFAYVASHDLQEPLRTIISFTQLLSRKYKGQLDDDADEFIDYIVTSARRMTDLINGLLALVRLRKEGQGLEPVDFSELAAEAEKSLQASIRETGSVVECGSLPSLVVEPIQFTQVLQNLISNSIKYRREDAPHIIIQALRDESHWIFSVTDNGRGFDQQFADRIFGLFQRLHGREVEGTGMGLTIAKRIVERHGGRIWAEGTEGQGATFYFSLPVSLESRNGIQAVSDAAEKASASAIAR